MALFTLFTLSTSACIGGEIEGVDEEKFTIVAGEPGLVDGSFTSGGRTIQFEVRPGGGRVADGAIDVAASAAFFTAEDEVIVAAIRVDAGGVETVFMRSEEASEPRVEDDAWRALVARAGDRLAAFEIGAEHADALALLLQASAASSITPTAEDGTRYWGTKNVYFGTVCSSGYRELAQMRIYNRASSSRSYSAGMSSSTTTYGWNYSGLSPGRTVYHQVTDPGNVYSGWVSSSQIQDLSIWVAYNYCTY